MIKIKVKKIFKRIAIIILIIAIFLCIIMTNGPYRKASFVENMMSGIIMAPQKLILSAYNFTKNNSYFDDFDELKQENINLKKEIERLNTKLADYDLISSKLRLYAEREDISEDFKDYKIETAEIVAISQNNFEKNFTINKGYEDGLRTQMPVITAQGLCGYITKVSKNTSNFVAIVDASTLLSARNSRTKDLVVASGSMGLMDDNKMIIKDIPFASTFESGDKIETSGIGGLYPKGISIGTIETVNNDINPLENTCIIKTCVDFNKIEMVAILIDSNQ